MWARPRRADLSSSTPATASIMRTPFADAISKPLALNRAGEAVGRVEADQAFRADAFAEGDLLFRPVDEHPGRIPIHVPHDRQPGHRTEYSQVVIRESGEE